MLRPDRAYIWDWRNSGQRSAYLNTPIWASVSSVGKPHSIECTAATACTIPPCLLGQACLGWMVTATLGCAGTISNRPARSSPIRIMSPHPQRQTMGPTHHLRRNRPRLAQWHTGPREAPAWPTPLAMHSPVWSDYLIIKILGSLRSKNHGKMRYVQHCRS